MPSGDRNIADYLGWTPRFTRCPFCAKRVDPDRPEWCVIFVDVEEPQELTAHNACLARAMHQWGKHEIGWIGS
jgi:hypothetical protein